MFPMRQFMIPNSKSLKGDSKITVSTQFSTLLLKYCTVYFGTGVERGLIKLPTRLSLQPCAPMYKTPGCSTINEDLF